MGNTNNNIMKNPAKVIFLDVDGVLRTYHWELELRQHYESQGIKKSHVEMSTELNPDSIAALVHIIKQADAKIVLSSSWRLSKEYSRIIEKALAQHETKIFSRTPRLQSSIRWEEIQDWLQKRPPCQSIIIDDDESAFNEYEAPSNSRFFHVTSKHGLTMDDANIIIDWLT